MLRHPMACDYYNLPSNSVLGCVPHTQSSSVLSAFQIRWADPTTWPWIGGTAILLAWSAITVWRWWLRQRVQEWPTTRGQIESATVGEKKILGTSGGSSAKFQAELNYSYIFEGQHYRGRYRKVVDSEPEGWEFVRDLESRTVMVSYNPRNPAKSALTQDAVTALLNQRPPGDETGFKVSDLPNWMKPLLWPMLALSVVGMALSLWVHLGAIIGKEGVPESLVAPLVTVMYVVWFSGVFVAQKRIGNLNRKNFWKLVLQGSPDWLRFAVYGFIAYAVLMFLLFLPQTATGNRGSDTLRDSWQRTAVSSAYWMVLFFSGLAIFYSAATARNDATKQLALKQ
jgi:hypothetical protein